MPDWAERIPAAIEKAEKTIGRRAGRFAAVQSPDGSIRITPGEVALAKALWHEFFDGQEPEYANKNMERPLDSCDVALRAFVEKVEAL